MTRKPTHFLIALTAEIEAHFMPYHCATIGEMMQFSVALFKI